MTKGTIQLAPILKNIYRDLQRTVLKTPIDQLTKRRLKSIFHSEFKKEKSKNWLKPSTYKDILKVKEYQEALLGIQRNGSKEAVQRILHLVYIQSVSLANRSPSWLFDFLTLPHRRRRDKVDLIEKYGGLLKIEHLINRFDNPNTIQEYYKVLIEKQVKSTPQNHSITAILNSQRPILEGEVYATPSSGKPKKKTKPKEGKPVSASGIISARSPRSKPIDSTTSQHHQNQKQASEKSDDSYIKLIERLRRQYKEKLDTRQKLPSLEVIIRPTLFGGPISNSQIFNLKWKRIVQLQDYFLIFPPLNKKDFEYLDNLLINKFEMFLPKKNHDDKRFNNIKFGYKEFLKHKFIVTTEGDMQSPRFMSTTGIVSDKIVKLYNGE